MRILRFLFGAARGPAAIVLIRLSVGLEDPGDLCQDLDRALAAMA